MKTKYLFITVFLLGLLFITSSVSAQNLEMIYSIILDYNKGSLTLDRIALITGYPNLLTDKSILDKTRDIYELDLFSKDGNLLFKGYFNVPNTVYPPPPLNPNDIKPGETDPIILEQVTFGFSLPYFKSGQTIKITKDSQELLAIDVSKFQMFCGDGKCQSDEDHQSCPQDCAGQKEPLPSPLGKGTGKLKNYLLYGGIAVVAVAVVILIVKKFRKKEPEVY